MATEVEEIARSGKDDEEDDGENMKSYDDVESSAFSDMKKEIGEEGANAVRDYVKACIQKATEEDEADEE